MTLGVSHWYGEHDADLDNFTLIYEMNDCAERRVVYTDKKGRIYKVIPYTEETPNEAEYCIEMGILKIGPEVFETKYYLDTIAIEMEQYPYDLVQYYDNASPDSNQKSKIQGLVHEMLWNISKLGYLDIDIKTNNIIYDDKTNRLRVIDFDPCYLKHVGSDCELEVELLCMIMLILFYFFGESHRDDGLFSELLNGKIGQHVELWKNKVLLSIAAECIEKTAKIENIYLHYQHKCSRKEASKKLKDIIKSGIPKVNTQRRWYSSVRTQLDSCISRIKVLYSY